MNFDELLGYKQADIAEEVVGAVGELGEPVEDFLAESGEVVGRGMEMEELLVKEAPELLDGVEPGRIGGQADQLDRQVQPPRLGRELVFHTRGADPGPGPVLGLQ